MVTPSRLSTGWLGIAAVAIVGGCTLIIGVDAGGDKPAGTGGATTTGTGTGGMGGSTACTPGMPVACYTGDPATRHKGNCKDGAQQCAADGKPAGMCMNQVLPQPKDDCTIPDDANCDGIKCSANVYGAIFDAGSTNGLAVSPTGEVFVTGIFGLPGEPSISLGMNKFSTAGGHDDFLVKLDASLKPVWAKPYGSVADEGGALVGATPDGGVIIAGELPGTLDFGCGPITNTSPIMDPYAGLFVAKIDGKGGCVWSKPFIGGSSIGLYGLAVDKAGDVVLTGTNEGDISFGGKTLPGVTGTSIFLAKLRGGDGAHAWSTAFTSPQTSTPHAVATDASGNVFFTGAVFDANLVLDSTHTAAPGIVVAKLDPFGGVGWAKSFGSGPLSWGGLTVAADPAGNVLVAGIFSGGATFGNTPPLDAGATSMAPQWFLAKLDPAGNAQWSKEFLDVPPDGIGNIAVAVDDAGSVVITGGYTGTVDFGGGPLANPDAAGGSILAKFDGAGNHLWSKRFGDAGGLTSVAVRTVPGTNQIVMAGNAAGTVDFGMGPMKCPGDDVFVATFQP